MAFGDVVLCSGQSNMALETYYTFSADTLKAEVAAGKYQHLRHFMNGGMGTHFEATTPQWVTTQNAAGTDRSSFSCTTHDQPIRLPVGTHACMQRERKGSLRKQC